MTTPAIFFGVVLSTAFGTAFHFLKGGSLNRLLLYIILAWAGFWIGHFIGAAVGWIFAPVGAVDAGMGSIGSLIVLFAGDWLGRIEVVRK